MTKKKVLSPRMNSLYAMVGNAERNLLLCGEMWEKFIVYLFMWEKIFKFSPA